MCAWRIRAAAWRERLRALLASTRVRTLAALAAILVSGAVGTVAVVSPDLPPAWRGVDAPIQRWGEAIVFSVGGQDLMGRRAFFDVVVMPKDYTWSMGSAAGLSWRGTPLSEAEAMERLFSAEVREGLGRWPEVIAVGVASQEGDMEEEEKRAEQRGRTQARLVGDIVSPLTGIWVLNLGQYNTRCNAASAADTSWQRPVLMIGVRFQDPGVALAQALENAMSGKSNIPGRDCYSSFRMARSR